jgi:hypothetical protein
MNKNILKINYIPMQTKQGKWRRRKRKRENELFNTFQSFEDRRQRFIP